jgi:hypothetical protein
VQAKQGHTLCQCYSQDSLEVQPLELRHPPDPRSLHSHRSPKANLHSWTHAVLLHAAAHGLLAVVQTD